MYDAILDQIRHEKESLGMTWQPPATPEERENLAKNTKNELGCEVPSDFFEFLTKTNGLGWNGLIVFATHRSQVVGHSDRTIEGIVEGNLLHRDFEPMEQYLIFGDDGTALYTLNLMNGKYEVVLRIGLSVVETYDSLPELFLNAFKTVYPP